MIETLDLHQLGDGSIHRLTRNAGQFMAEAASICLEEKAHQQGCQLDVTGFRSQSYLLIWPPADDTTRRTHKTGQNAIEHGACGVAILLASQSTEYQVVEQSRSRGGLEGGFDYWLGEKRGDSEELGLDARLEVSGILSGNKSKVKARVKRKLTQTDQSDKTKVPAFVVVGGQIGVGSLFPIPSEERVTIRHSFSLAACRCLE